MAWRHWDREKNGCGHIVKNNNIGKQKDGNISANEKGNCQKTQNKHKSGGVAAKSFNLKTQHQNRLRNLLTHLMVEWHSPAPMSVDHYD